MKIRGSVINVDARVALSLPALANTAGAAEVLTVIASRGQESGHKRHALCRDGQRGDSIRDVPEKLVQSLMGRQEIRSDPVCAEED